MSHSNAKKHAGRFASPPEKQDPESAEFKAQLEASLKDFDAAAALQIDSPPRRTVTPEALPNPFPELAPPDLIEPPGALAQTSRKPKQSRSELPNSPHNASLDGLDLLSELRQAARTHEAESQSAEAALQARVERADQALRQLFRYLIELTGHLNKIRPLVPRQFRPLPNIELSELHWSESFVDYRTRGGTEISPFESVSLRYTISAGTHIPVSKLPNYANAWHDELKRVGLRYTATEQRGTRGLVEQINFQVAREVSVSLSFHADPATERIELRTRNFTELSSETYFLPVSHLDQHWLDELGKHILGRPNRLLSTLQTH